MGEITIYDRLPKACPTCGSDEPTIYYGSCFDNVHDALFDPRLPMDPWHAYMNELRYLHKAVDGMTVSYEVCRDLLVEVRAERDALAAAIRRHMTAHCPSHPDGDTWACCNDDLALWAALDPDSTVTEGAPPSP